MLWELDRAPGVMRWYREFITTAPEDLNGFFVFLTVPPGPSFPERIHLRKMCGIVWQGLLRRRDSKPQPGCTGALISTTSPNLAWWAHAGIAHRTDA